MNVLFAALPAAGALVPTGQAAATCLPASPTDPTELCVELVPVGHDYAAHGWFEPAGSVPGHLEVKLYGFPRCSRGRTCRRAGRSSAPSYR